MSIDLDCTPPSPAAGIAANSQRLNALRAEVCRLVDQIDRWNGRSGSILPPGTASVPAGDAEAALRAQSDQIAALAGEIRQLEGRLRGLENLSLTAPRKPMHVQLAELIIGREYHRTWWGRSEVPAVTIIIPAGDDDSTAATVRSVLGQSQSAGWEVVVVGAEPGERLRQALDSGAGRARHVLLDGPIWDCLDKGLSEASAASPGRVIGIVHPGQQFEPTAANSLIRFFRNHPRAMSAYFEKTVRRGPWRMPMPRGRRMDVYGLLAEEGTHGWGHGGVFFRRRALGMVGGFKPAMRGGAEWHLYLRLARMFGLRRAAGQVLCITQGEAAGERCGEYLEFVQAEQEFLGNFGIAGRLRCWTIHLLNVLLDLAEPGPRKVPVLPGATSDDPVESAAVECPHCCEDADRLLFTAADAAGRPGYVYKRPDGLGARIHGPTPLPGNEKEAGDEDLLGALLSRIEAQEVRVLVPADSPVVDLLARQTKWKITRLPADVPLEDAALELPEESRFDVIWAGPAIRRSADPAALLRSLQSVLAPGGIVTYSGPNFDSRRRHQLGVEWPGWNPPRYPFIFSRRGVRELARLSDLRVLSMRRRADEWRVLLVAE